MLKEFLMDRKNHTESFVSQVMDSQRQLYAYILTLEPIQSDADDILQETNLVIWRKREEFQAGTNLWAWICRIAYFEVLAFRKKRGQDRLQFDPLLTETLASEATRISETLSPRRAALSYCLEKLSQPDCELLTLRYTDTLPANKIAKKIDRSVNAVYQVLHRIRTSLLSCIKRRLASSSEGKS